VLEQEEKYDVRGGVTEDTILHTGEIKRKIKGTSSLKIMNKIIICFFVFV